MVEGETTPADDGGEGAPASPSVLQIRDDDGADAVVVARRWTRSTARSFELGHLSEDAELIVSELVTNALLHAMTPIRVEVGRSGPGLHVAVHDGAPERLPVTSGTGLLELLGLDDVDDLTGGISSLDVETMTGRGMTLVAALSQRWGVEVRGDSKVVWAELATGLEPGPAVEVAAPRAPAGAGPAGPSVRVPGVPVRLVLTAAAQLDDLVRELGVTALPSSLPPDIVDVAARFVAMTAQVRDPFRVAARAAVEQGERLLDVSFPVGPDTVPGLRGFLAVLEQITDLSVRGDLLCLAPPPEVMAFRRWAVDEIARQVGGAAPQPCPFPVVPRDDPAVAAAAARARQVLEDTAPDDSPTAAARPVAEHAADPVALAGPALAAAVDLDDITAALVDLGVALGATNGSLCLLAEDGVTVELAAQVGYGEAVRAHWSTFSVTSDLPASEVIRTGEPVFVHTAAELAVRFPVLVATPLIDSEALAVLPLGDGSVVRGALVLGYERPRAFSPAARLQLEHLAFRVCAALSRIGPTRTGGG